MQSTPARRFDPYFQVDWLKLLPFDFYSCKFGYVCDPMQMHQEPTGRDRQPLSGTTGNYVAGTCRLAGHENQTLVSPISSVSAQLVNLRLK